ncbi:hypothetical protein K439DRAFT_1617919 [Ramaria rubella]|nr:hypothetical protein K439DRAFT_1617919 [Ramaria rubella]
MAKGIPTKHAPRPTPSATTSRAQRATAHAGKKSITDAGALPTKKNHSVKKKKNGKPSADTEIISVHSSSPFVESSFFLRQCTDVWGQREPVANRPRSLKRERTPSLVVKQEDDVKEDNPSPSKKSKKQLQGIIPMSDEETIREIAAANEGGWSDGSSLSGFIVDDDVSLEVMTDSGNEAVSSGEVLTSSPPKHPANKGKGVQELQSQTIIDHTQMVDQGRVLEAVGLLQSKDSHAQSAEAPEHPPKSPIRLSQTSQSHPPHTPKVGEQGASGSGASQATSSWDDNDNSYYQCMKEYQANRPAKCAILDDILDLSKEHRELLLDVPCWSFVVQWSTDYPPRLWTYKDFSEWLSVEWFRDFLNKPYYGKNYANFARFPESKHVWRSMQDPSAFGKSGSYITDWQFNKGATVNVLLGGVGLCKLIDHILLNGKLHRQICIYPLDGEWQSFVTMIGTVYMTGSLEFNTYKGAIIIGT